MQRSALIVVGVVIAAGLVGAVGSGAAQSDGDVVTITVNTVVGSSNQQVGGVTLVATWNGGQTTVTTASNGKAFIDIPTGTPVEITTDDDEYIRNQPYRIGNPREQEYTVDIARQAEVDIVVNDGEGPVADAFVSLAQDGTTVVSGRTDSQGRFQSGTIEQGTYTVAAVKAGYYRTTDSIIVAGSPERTVGIERGRVDYDIRVEDPQFDTAQPVSDATVTIRGVGELTTDDRGTAASLLPVNTEVQITVSKDGYESTTRTISVGERSGSAVFSLSRTPSLSLTAVNQRIVVGEVVPVEVRNAYGDPAEGVTILYDGEPVGQTNAEGRLTVRIDSTGEHEIRARRGGTTSDVVTVTGIEGAAGQETTATESAESGTTAAATDDGSGLDGLLLPALIVVAVLVILVVLVVLFLRRRSGPDPDPDFGRAGGDTVSSGGFGAETTTGPGTESDTAATGGSVSETSAGSDAETGTTTGASAGADADADVSSDTDAPAGAGADADAGAGADASGGSDAESQESSETGTDTGAGDDSSEAGSDTESSADSETGTEDDKQ